MKRTGQDQLQSSGWGEERTMTNKKDTFELSTFELSQPEKKTIVCQRCKIRMRLLQVPKSCPFGCGSTDLRIEREGTPTEVIDRWNDYCNIYLYHHEEMRCSQQESKRRAIAEMIAFGFIKNEQELCQWRERHLKENGGENG